MIKRRRFLTICGGLFAGIFAAGHSRPKHAPADNRKQEFVGPPMPDTPPIKKVHRKRDAIQITDLHPDFVIADNAPLSQDSSTEVKVTEIILDESDTVVFNAVIERLARLQNYVGYGNFNVIGWDQSLRIARSRDRVGEFSKSELEFIEKLFFTNADLLGFYGDKVVTELSSTIAKKDIVKIPGSGHYLFKGEAADTYYRIRRDVGDSIVLTSGIRSVVKQIYLFLNKAARVNGNLSLASYSLAPPGHSYHALGDFDVGKQGFGRNNFSAKFADTDEFRRLLDLGYLDIRYPQNNPYGVRYEPWHIKVV